jgi:hypothetical protein
LGFKWHLTRHHICGRLAFIGEHPAQLHHPGLERILCNQDPRETEGKEERPCPAIHARYDGTGVFASTAEVRPGFDRYRGCARTTDPL